MNRRSVIKLLGTGLLSSIPLSYLIWRNQQMDSRIFQNKNNNGNNNKNDNDNVNGNDNKTKNENENKPNDSSQKLMPILFCGHGSPMNAIETNTFTNTLATLGTKLPKPKAILCISAHWLTKGTWLTHMQHPKTIHDFYGFPKELFKVNYPAEGSPQFAENIQKSMTQPQLQLDSSQWGLDHGTWSVLTHLFPNADVPVLQLSIDIKKPLLFHLQLGEQLRQWRSQGVLIIGSGNIVHNLGLISWETQAPVVDWAQEFDAWVKSKIEGRDINALVHDIHQTHAGELSVPSLDHYIPLLYIMGAAQSGETAKFIFEGFQNASISMRSFGFGLT